MLENFHKENKDQINREKSGDIFGIKKINNFLLSFSRVPLRERLFFTQYLDLMLRSGISLFEAVEVLSKQTPNKNFAKILLEVSANINRGVSFTESLRPHEKVFGELYINMIEAGESSGRLEDVLLNLYFQMKKQHWLNSKVKGALIYPIVILSAILIVGLFMAIMVLPELLNILKSYDIEMPLLTKVFIAASEFVLYNGFLSLIAFALLTGLIIQAFRIKKSRFYLQGFFLKLPVISPIIKKINLARFSRTISILLKTDIMIVKTFKITANTLGNLHYQKAVFEISENLKKGVYLNEVVLKYPDLFSPAVAQMIMVGEKTGELDNVLSELADFYENEVDQTMENLPSIIEPVLIVFLGLMVGVIAIAIMLPYYTLISSF